MQLKDRISSLIFLGNKIKEVLENHAADEVIEQAYLENNWFSHEFIRLSLNHISEFYLKEEKIMQWIENYQLTEKPSGKLIALILAGNLPLVGFHDVICNYISGHRSLIRMSHKDKVLLPYLISELNAFNPDNQDFFIFEEKLSGFDAVIATGSNTSAPYFKYYFGKYPHIIRHNRNSVAILTAEENEKDLKELSNDIFYYYGLGCRNVSKIYIPEDYDLKPLLNSFEKFAYFDNFFRYANNYQYNRSIYLVNQIPHLDNGFLLLKEDEGFHPPIAVLFYEVYQSVDEVIEKLHEQREHIQVVAGNVKTGLPQVSFGKTQFPELWDYADEVDTLNFLQTI